MSFLPFSAVIMRGHRTARERPEYSMTVPSAGSARVRCAKFENIIKDWKMQICQINVLNNKIDDIIYANVSKLHEYCNKFVRKSLVKIFFFIDCGNIS